MDVTTIVGGNQPQKNNNVERNAPARIRAVVETVVRAADSVLAEQSTASRLQARETGFRQAANNLARATTLAQTADGGVRQIRDEVRKLRTAGGDDVKKIRENIDRIAKNTTFEAKPLLDGSREKISLEETVSGTRGGRDDVELRLPDLSSRRLLGDAPAPAPERVDEALRTVDAVAGNLDDFKKSANIVAASIDTVVANQRAAQAELQPEDFERTPLREIRENREAAVGAQAKIPPALVKLVS